VGEQDEVDRERAGEVADDHTDRALVPDRDEQDRGDDGEHHVHERGRDVGHGALLDAEEGRQLLVVHLPPEEDEGGADERRP